MISSPSIPRLPPARQRAGRCRFVTRPTIRVLENARDELLAVFAAAGSEPRLATYRLELPGTSAHYGGTCRMHESPSFGVVDANCRVHGIRNVVVADSAVFTTGAERIRC